MTQPLRVLHLEDDPHDAELVQATLAAEGLACQVVRVDTRAEFVEALERGGYDLILADYVLPAFDGMTALTLAQEKFPHLPFLFVSGGMGEDMAIEACTHGATDYVLKQNLSRLVPAVRRVVREVEERTTRKRVEEQLRQSQKMEAVGRLAGGIAHDFNNLLTIMMGYSELLLKRLGPDDPLRGAIEQIKKAGDRGAALARQLLIFSRQQILQLQVLDLNAVVTGINPMLQRVIGEDTHLVTALDPAVDRVKADPGQLEQVVMNLVVNARDAMPQGGTLTIETANVELGEPHAGQLLALQPGPYAMLAVSDTGCGMDAETQARIFEPFFTTKGAGKGTGLGLSTVYGIVKQSGGDIWVYSEPGRGATFKIYLPRVKEDARPLQLTVAPARPLMGTETVLLVEDEPGVRAFVRDTLGLFGYTVLEARHGIEALMIGTRHAGPIHLLITDVVMPQMDGREIADRLGPLRSEMKVLYMSGYTDDAVVSHGVLEAGTAFLQKPFTPDALARKIRDVLDG
jgi:signal transduction histidine kinase